MKSLPALFLLFLWVGSPASAQADEPALHAFVQQVLARNPSLRARNLARESLRARADAEGYWPDPEVSVMLDRVPERMDGEMPMVRYQLNQMFMWPGKLRLMETAAGRQAEAAAADVDVRKRELVREAQQAYLMLAQNKGYRQVNESTRRLLDAIVQSAIARYGAGSGGHHEVVRAEVEQNALAVDAVALDGERTSIVVMLNALRDFPVDSVIAEPADLESKASTLPPLPSLVRTAVAHRPELKRMRAMAQEESTMAELSRRQRYPDFMAGVWYNQMLGGADTAGVMVGTNLPLFSAPQQSRRARAAELSAQGTLSELSAMQAMIRYQVADAYRRVDTAWKTLELVTTVARPRAEQSFASALSAYSTGAADLVLVLDAWRALQRMELARIDGVVGYRMALSDLEWAVGGSLKGGAS